MYHRVNPQNKIKDLQEFIQWQPEVTEFYAFTKNGQQYIAAYGPLSGLLPAGSTVYIFDVNNQFLEWTSDEGDDNAFMQNWSPYIKRGQNPIGTGQLPSN
jgi:hypothetical protein